MDEELINLSTEEAFEVDAVEVVESQVKVEDLEQKIETEETLDVVEVETIEEVDIAVDEAIGWVGGDSTRHYSLYGRDEYDQHPITAITGLRAELDNIEKLQTVYSDKRSQANYYKWQDENILQENRVGYFVSIHEDINKIQICTGDNVFGVTVDAAGFIGGQSEIPRDITYGLVVCDGIAAVRCELDVSADDYVIPNNYGMAQKVDNGYGYKVIALQDIGGVKHAVINLQIEINKIRNLVNNVDNLDERVGEAESNIVSAINMANAAYNKAGEAEYISEKALKDALESLKKSEETSDIIKDLENNISQNNTMAIEARANAESAAVSAESIRQEAETTANKALTETSELRKEFETKVVEIDTELDNAVIELEATKEGFNETINELKLDTYGQLADFKKEVEDNYATTTQLAAVKTENSDAVAALKQEVSDTYATTETVTALQTETSEAIAGLKQEVTDTYATQEMLTAYKNDTSEALSLYKTEVEENYAMQEMVSKLEEDTTKALTDYKQEVTNTYATQEMVTKLETDTSKALTDYKQEVGDTYATQTSLATLKTDTTNAITASEEKATQTYASKSDLTSFENNTNIAMARIEQKADDNGASITSIVSSIDKYSVGEYSQSYGLTHEQAVSILKEGIIYIPTEHLDTESHLETFEDTGETNEFTPRNYYEWDGNDWIEYLHSVAFSSVEPTLTGTLKYWYIDSDTAPIGYEPYTLYMYENGKWIKVNIFYNNPSNRMVSSISQEVDEISAEIVNARGSVAALDIRLTNDEAEIQSLALWSKGGEEDGKQYNLATIKQTADNAGASIAQVVESVGKDGEVNAASIVTAINGQTGDSIIKLDAKVVDIEADSIDLTGYVTIESLKGEETTEINGSNITTGSIQSGNYVADTSGMKLNLADGVWDSKYFKIDTEGNIAATGGTIGGWTIGEDQLSYTDTGDYYIKPSSDKTDIVFKIGDNFEVYGDGRLWTSNIYAQGGEIGGCTFKDGKLQIPAANITDKIKANQIEAINISVESLSVEKITGGPNYEDITFYGAIKCTNIDASGRIEATSGTIGDYLTITSTGLRYDYDGDYADIINIETDVSGGDSILTSINCDKINCGAIGTSYSPLGGYSGNLNGRWTLNNSSLVTQNTVDSAVSTALNSLSTISIVRNSTNSAGINFLYNTTQKGRIMCDSSDFRISGGGDIHIGALKEIKLYAYVNEQSYYNFVVNKAGGWLRGSWYVDNEYDGSGNAISSDINKKHSIVDMPEQYSTFFDNINPVIYKYNDGTSDRYHTGFIAQEIESALDVAEISTQDFAGLVIDNIGKEDESYYLRYSEFVALNTWQIQKAKARITELEAQVASLTDRLETLEKGE